MKILITNDIEDVYMSFPGKTMAEKKTAYYNSHWQWREALEKSMGEWVEVETDHLFEDQFNTADARFQGLWIIKAVDLSPEFKDREEFIAAVQKQYDEKWPGHKVNRYFIDKWTKQ